MLSQYINIGNTGDFLKIIFIAALAFFVIIMIQKRPINEQDSQKSNKKTSIIKEIIIVLFVFFLISLIALLNGGIM